MSLQDHLNEIRAEAAAVPVVEEFDFSPCRFEVEFTELPDCFAGLQDSLPFLIAGTTLPSIGDSYHKEWFIRVMPNLDVYDAFHTWAKSFFELKGSAVITLYKANGDVLRKYPVNDLQIMSVSSINLDWDIDDEEPVSFEVSFRIECATSLMANAT